MKKVLDLYENNNNKKRIRNKKKKILNSDIANTLLKYISATHFHKLKKTVTTVCISNFDIKKFVNIKNDEEDVEVNYMTEKDIIMRIPLG